MRPVIRASLALVLMAQWPAPRSVADDAFRFEPESVPAPFLDAGGVDSVIEASAVLPLRDGNRILVAHDKAPEFRVAELDGGRTLGPAVGSPGLPAITQKGPKWEGMARDSLGLVYVIGAHDGKTDAERAQKAHLLRFRLDEDVAPPVIIEDSVARWDVAGPIVAALKSEGLDGQAIARRKVEGLAVRERPGAAGEARRELVIGLREPGDHVRAYAAELADFSASGEAPSLSPVFRFKAPRREGVEAQLTSLEYVPALGGFLALTATEDESNVFHGNTLWFIADGRSEGAVEVATFEVAMKAEGLAVLGTDQVEARTEVRLVVVFDNDALKTRIPSRYLVARLVRESR